MLTDLRQAFRSLLRSPGFLATAVLVLALGLGVNAILFNTVNALLWRPLNFPNADRLVTLRCVWPTMDPMSNITIADAVLLKERVDCLAEVGIVDSNSHPLRLARDGQAVSLTSTQVNSGYLRALGLRPVAGRFFDEEDDREGDFQTHRAPELRGLLMESAWRTRFGADAGVVGRSLPLAGGRSLRILGIVPSGATLPFAHRAEVLLTLPWMHPEQRGESGSFNSYNVLRMEPGVSLTQASEQMKLVMSQPDPGGDMSRQQFRYFAEPLRNALVPKDRKPILLLAGAAGLLLLLVGANVASLFVARSLGRAQDTALRLALGASRLQSLRVPFLEALLVCAAGIALALWLNQAARPLVLLYLPELRKVGAELLDTGPMLLFASLGVCLLLALVMGWVAAAQSGNAHLAASMAEGSRRGSGQGKSWRRVLVSTQVAVIVVLLSLGGLAWHSLWRSLHGRENGDMRGVVAIEFTLPAGHERDWALAEAWVDRVASLPSTQSLSLARMIPFEGSLSICNAGAQRGEPQMKMYPRQGVGAGYFATLRMVLVAGRDFTRDEALHRDPVAVLNESAARRLFPDADPLGRTVFMSDKPFTVVGVARDARFKALDEPAAPMLFPLLTTQDQVPGNLLVRSTADPRTFASALNHLASESTGIRIDSVRPLQSYAEKSVEARTHASLLVGGFALLGLLVGSVGLYGTLSAQVQQQRREIGIRLALGSTGGQILARILVQGAGWVLPGVVVGVGLSVAAAHLVRHVLYGIEPVDTLSFTAGTLLLLLAAFLACLIPALRATRVQPAEALRSE